MHRYSQSFLFVVEDLIAKETNQASRTSQPKHLAFKKRSRFNNTTIKYSWRLKTKVISKVYWDYVIKLKMFKPRSIYMPFNLHDALVCTVKKKKKDNFK